MVAVCGGGDCGLSYGYGCDCAVIYGGNTCIATLPRDIFVCGVAWLYRCRECGSFADLDG